MLYNLTTTAVQIVKELDALTFGPDTGLVIRHRAIENGSYDVVTINNGPDTMYWANGHDADADSIPVLVGQGFTVSTDKVDDVTFVSAGTSALSIEYSRTSNQIAVSSAPGGGGVTPATTSRASFCVDEKVATFKSYFANVSMLENPVDSTIFFDDDTLGGAKGVILTVEEFLTTSSPIISTVWTNLVAPVGANAANGAVGVNGSRVFIRTHDADGITPTAVGGQGGDCLVTFANGVTINPAIFYGTGYNLQRILLTCTSNVVAVTQSLTTDTEVDWQFRTFQPNIDEQFNRSHFTLNIDPISPAFSFMLAVAPCPYSLLPTVDTSWNSVLLTPCDQGSEYTNSTMLPVGDFKAIGTDTAGGAGDYTVATANTSTSVFSYDKN